VAPGEIQSDKIQPDQLGDIEPIAWFDELHLDPLAHPVAMGTRSLGERPWLLIDGRQSAELELKDQLLVDHRDQVLHLTEDSRPAALELARRVGVTLDSDLHPLEQVARSVQEDLCLLRRRDDGWHLDASCLCFPTRWHLQEKVGLHIAQVHGPVDGYDPRITAKVDRLFDQLTERPVWRRNWFLMTDPTLYQPDRPEREVVISSANVDTELFIRSERQTLRRLSPQWIVFTIRIQQEPLGRLLTDGVRRAAFATWVRDVSGDFGARRHLSPPQRAELLDSLGRWATVWVLSSRGSILRIDQSTGKLATSPTTLS